MKLIFFFTLLGCALALQAPVEYEYRYEARVGTGMQSSRPEYAGTGIKAKVRITMQEDGSGEVKLTEVEVGEAAAELLENGRDVLDIDYKAIEDKSLELPYKAFFRRQDGETVLEVPEDDALWVTNVRRGVANFFRIAPIVQPGSVPPPPVPGGELVYGYSRIMDTFAGRCRVQYTITPAARSDVQTGLREDIQSMRAPKGPGGQQVKLDDDLHYVQSSIDFSTCSDRVFLSQTGAGNLTNVTSSSYRDVSARSHIGVYILQGQPGKFRMQRGDVESSVILQPLGFNSAKVVIMSNQSMELVSAKPVPRNVRSSAVNLKAIKTWNHQFESPKPKPEGFAPRFIHYKNQDEPQYSPVLYERLVTGFGLNDKEMQESFMERVTYAIEKAAKRCRTQNKDSEDAPPEFRGTEDGRIAQGMMDAMHLLRALNYERVQELEKKIHEHPDKLVREIFVDALAAAASGPTIKVLLRKIKDHELSGNRTASIFFNLANNIRSAEVIEDLVDFAISLQEEKNVTASLLVKNNVALIVRRICVSSQIKKYSHMMYAFGSKMCDRNKIVNKYLPHLEQKIESSQITWVKMLNVIAAADLGARESIPILEKVARGDVSNDIFLRYAAIHGLSANNFDNSSRDKIFNVLQPIAESKVEDYRIRQVAYDSLLTFMPNVTFLQRMIFSSHDEPSQQVQSYISWVIDSLARIEDPRYKPLSTAARNALALTRFMPASLNRPVDWIFSRYLNGDEIGIRGSEGWLSQYKSSFPREIYSFVSGKFGRFGIPILETITFGNSQAMYSKLRSAAEEFTRKKGPSSAQEQERKHRLHDQFHKMHGGRHHNVAGASEQEPDIYHFSRLWRTSEVFLPLTNDLYQQTKGYMQNALKNLGEGEEQNVLFFKYLNPVESNVILPTPPGLFMKIELNTPTVLFGEVKMRAKMSPRISDPSELPTLQKIDFKAEGIVKAISKTTSYSYVLAPWTNRTVMCGVDVEKTVSMPLKYEIVANLRTPAQILWAELTPQFNQTEHDIPIIKIRTLPFTAIAGLIPTLEGTPSHGGARRTDKGGFFEMKRVQWIEGTNNWFKESWSFSKANTGLNLKFDYRGEVQPPFRQSNVMRFLREPSRMMSLLASPTIKNYDLSIYQLKEKSETKSIGAAIRFLQQPGTGEPITAESCKKSVDFSTDDTIEQREQKLKKFSNQENYELSAMVNFTGDTSVHKAYEVVLVGAENKEVAPEPDFETISRKIQLSILEVNSESSRPKKTCGVVAQIKQQLVSMPRPQAAASNENIRSDVNFDVLQGESCAAGAQTIVEGTTILKVSPDRLDALRNITGGIPLSQGNSSEFYKLAVYDELDMDVKWKEPSATFKNLTMKTQDLIEGYLFPKIVKNRLAKNQDKMMVVRARRFVGDNRANARVQLPHQTVNAETVNVITLFDALLSFAPSELQNSHQSRSGARVVQAPSGDICLVKPEHVQTFDGVGYRKQATGCASAAVKVSQGQDNLAVLTSQPSKSASGPQEVKVISSKSGLEIDVTGQNIRVNGESMTEPSKVIKDSAGNTVAKVSKTADLVTIAVTNKMVILIKQGNLMTIKLDKRFKNIAKGMCGDFNSDTKNDLCGPKGCIYKPADGPKYAASWVADESTCQEQEMKKLFKEVEEYQKDCPKGHRQALSRPSPCSNPSHVYPIGREQDTICVGKYTVIHCQSGCHSAGTHEVAMQSKCWSSRTAPEEVRESLSRGYMTSLPTEKADSERSFPQKSPTGCIQGRPSSLESGRCTPALSVYPVTKASEELCVGEHKVMKCPSACRPQREASLEMQSKCWSPSKAPESVKEAESRGYMDHLPSEPAENTKELTLKTELNCVPKGSQLEQQRQGQQQHQRHHQSVEGQRNREEQQQRSQQQQQQDRQRHHQSVEGQQDRDQQQQQHHQRHHQSVEGQQDREEQERWQQEQQQNKRSHPRHVGAGSDHDCYINEAYPVRAVSSELCVTKQPSRVCKHECRAADSVPTNYEAKCWQKHNAPEKVKEAERRGYTTSPVNEADERTREISIQVPHSCFKRH